MSCMASTAVQSSHFDATVISRHGSLGQVSQRVTVSADLVAAVPRHTLHPKKSCIGRAVRHRALLHHDPSGSADLFAYHQRLETCGDQSASTLERMVPSIAPEAATMALGDPSSATSRLLPVVIAVLAFLVVGAVTAAY